MLEQLNRVVKRRTDVDVDTDEAPRPLVDEICAWPADERLLSETTGSPIGKAPDTRSGAMSVE
jgi:hypothetical protein